MDQATREVVRRAFAEHSPSAVDPTGLTPAGVLVLLYGSGEGSTVLLSKRSEALTKHPGEMSFPGGRCEPSDADLLQTALREAHEEVGVTPGDVEVLGELGVFSTSSDFAISAFVGAIDQPYKFMINPSEVAGLVEVPVRQLLDHRNVRDDVRVVDEDLVVMPAFSYAGHLIFGATARILDRLIEVLGRTEAWQALGAGMTRTKTEAHA
jgi:8-oxo-dGTP pyrophosphatase MutT (NUDIX family)